MTLTSADFPAGTPLHHFFAWNESAHWWRDRRYDLARDPGRLPRPLADRLTAAAGNSDIGAHAAVFAALDELEHSAGAGWRILVIRLSALGDFVQALGPIAAIRRHHAGDHLSLLTTRPLAAFAEELGHFDEVLVDERPSALAIGGWLSLLGPASSVIEGITVIGFLGFFVWMASMGVALLRRRGAAGTADRSPGVAAAH